MNVLSLFDGMSCGRIALEKAGIKVNNYFASEIEQASINVTKKNYPDTMHLGDVLNVSYRDGVLYSENGAYDVGKIDLVIGGSPCQGFSFAGKQLNFNDPRSVLFFEWLRICNEVCPSYFLLENVKMQKNSENVITEKLGVSPVLIDSSFFSAQKRQRLYWTNIDFDKKIIDKGIYIKDILDPVPYELFKDDRIENTKVRTKNYFKWDISGKGYYSQQDRAYFKDGKMCCVPKSQVKSKVNVVESDGVYRRLSPVEVERLQNVPDNYTLCDSVSSTKRYEMLGNGWTVDVIAHIFKGLK